MPRTRHSIGKSRSTAKTAFALICLYLSISGGTADAASPYRLDWRTDGAIVAATLATGAAATAVSGNGHLSPTEVRELSRSSVNWLDRSATYRYSTTSDKASSALVGVWSLAPLLLSVTPKMRHDWQVVGVMYLETWFLANWAPDICKGTIDRVRPYLYNPEAPLDEKVEDSSARRSFYSGHTTLAFATATFSATILGDYYPTARWASRTGKGLLLTAAGVGYLRYAAGAHYPTDVLVGTVVGSAIGYLIPRLHRRDGDRRLILAPQPLVSGWALSLRWAL